MEADDSIEITVQRKSKDDLNDFYTFTSAVSGTTSIRHRHDGKKI
jgi:hypothetical protein